MRLSCPKIYDQFVQDGTVEIFNSSTFDEITSSLTDEDISDIEILSRLQLKVVSYSDQEMTMRVSSEGRADSLISLRCDR